MTRADKLNRLLYAPTFALLALALALVALGNPAAVPVAIGTAAWPALWVAVSLAWEDQIAAWLAACPVYRAIVARRLAEQGR